VRGTNGQNTTGLGIGDGAFYMAGVTGSRVQIHVGISGFCIEISNDLLRRGLLYKNVKKRDFFGRVDLRETDTRMGRINRVNKFQKFRLSMIPDNKNIIDKTEPTERFEWN
jgi:hypothetical protein